MDGETSLTVAGLFAGIGGIELGLHAAGHRTTLLSDIEPASQEVLKDQFPRTTIVGDVREIVALPGVDVCAAGFPCQDLSQAGRTAGIGGTQSGLVNEVFRLASQSDVRWLLLENVPFMLQLDRGEAMRFLTTSLEQMGFNWAYRVVDTRCFGLPQRRQRVVVLASRTHDPRPALFSQDAGEPEKEQGYPDVACGFYWTEGNRGLGWAVDGVPTLKGGSGIGIPSPPAIRFPDGFIGLPEIRDAERLQGFEPDWTLPATRLGLRAGARWKLVGNAVSVPLARWVGERLTTTDSYESSSDRPFQAGATWPHAAWGYSGLRRQAQVTRWPVRNPYQSLEQFLRFPVTPLSVRAAEGFLKRARSSRLRFAPGFLDDVEAHARSMRASAVAA